MQCGGVKHDSPFGHIYIYCSLGIELFNKGSTEPLTLVFTFNVWTVHFRSIQTKLCLYSLDRSIRCVYIGHKRTDIVLIDLNI